MYYYVCEICKINFRRESQMKKEKIKILDKEVEILVCSFCGFTKKL
ncbi:MAG: hypothetical protein QXD89_02720 [Candidatus Aenigmatarchaeota archaeon]